MKEFIEKLIERLEEHKIKAYVTGITNNPYEFGACNAMDSAISIVNQLAEEYKHCIKSSCSNCEVYDTEKHYCPKWCDVIKGAVTEVKENNTSTEYINCSTDTLLEEYVQTIDVTELVGNPEQVDNGWIPVSSGRLPTVSNSYLVTQMCENEGNPIYETAHEIFWTSDNKWDCERDPDNEWKVIAWREKLAPYQPKGE